MNNEELLNHLRTNADRLKAWKDENRNNKSKEETSLPSKEQLSDKKINLTSKELFRLIYTEELVEKSFADDNTFRVFADTFLSKAAFEKSSLVALNVKISEKDVNFAAKEAAKAAGMSDEVAEKVLNNFRKIADEKKQFGLIAGRHQWKRGIGG